MREVDLLEKGRGSMGKDVEEVEKQKGYQHRDFPSGPPPQY